MGQSRTGILRLFLLLALFAGCATVQKIVKPPTAKIEGFQITGGSFNEITLNFQVLVQNPNPFPIELKGFDYAFAIENKKLFEGEENRPLQISSSSTSSLNIPVTINFHNIYKLAKELKTLDTLSYHFSGNLKPGALLTRVRVPISKSGKIPNVRFPQISIENLTVKKLNFSGVEMDLFLNIKNPNTFDLAIDSLDYVIKLDGQEVVSAAANKFANIKAKSGGQVRLPLSLSFFGVASSLASALTGQRIECNIVGHAGVNTPLGLLDLPIDVSNKIEILKQ